ncbi:glycosyltransferase [Thermodesulfovibrionales bacterium]|nr:glycosyltransferase [Thermodesulfovibrionales bacterium]
MKILKSEIKEGNIIQVLILASYFPKPHNPAMGVWALEQAKALQRKGVEVVVISPTPWVPKTVGITSKIKGWASVPNEYNWDGIKAYYPKCLSYPVGIIKKVYVRVPYIQYYPVWRAVQMLMLAKRMNPDLIYCHHPLIEGMVGLAIKEKYGIPLVVIEHSLTDIQYASDYSTRKKAYTHVLCKADAVVTVSKRLANRMEQFLPDSSKTVSVIRNGVDISKLSAQKMPKPNLYRNKKVILSVGWLEERKGHHILIQAIKKVSLLIPTIKCIIIGRGSKEGQLRELINQLHLEEYVEIMDNVPHNKLIEYMSWCDVFALPSWNEPFGVVYAEAMGCETPIIGTKGEGIAEVIEEGKHGLLVSPNDVDSLSQALLTLLQNDELARRMGKAGRQLVLSELSWETNASNTISVFRKLL